MKFSRSVGVVSSLGLLALVFGVWQQRHAPGYHQINLTLGGGVPATLYFADRPGQAPNALEWVLQPPAPDEWRAGVVAVHGFAADRNTMAGLAESLVGAGYVVLSIDLSGHGQNRNAFAVGETGPMVRQVAAAVQYLAQRAWIEPARIAVLGHSMGAMVALDYGFHATDIGGLVMLSGGTVQRGPEHPRNALFLYAERDLPVIEPLERPVATRLAAADPFREGRTYGDFAAGTAVRMAKIPGASHGSIVTSAVAFAEIVNWLDQITGLPARDGPPAPVSHPLGPPLLWIAFFLVLPGIGWVLGRLAPDMPAGSSRPRWPDLVLLPIALLLPLAFVAAGRPGVLAETSLADANVTYLSLAGILLLAAAILLGRLRVPLVRVPMALVVAAAGWGMVIFLLGPVSAQLHGVGLTPEKALLTLWAAVCLAPIALAMQWLLHRPQWWRGTLLRLVARILVILVTAAGVALGIFEFSGVIAIFALILSLAIIEPVLAGFYGQSRNLITAAGFDALVTAWLLVLFLPAAF